jgi:hypothetical protein
VDEGKDYKASFAVIANKKIVIINATLHFVSQEDYTTAICPKKVTMADAVAEDRYTIDGRKIGKSTRKGLNIVRMSDGTVRKVLVR